jgi:hypothetical protein
MDGNELIERAFIASVFILLVLVLAQALVK